MSGPPRAAPSEPTPWAKAARYIRENATPLVKTNPPASPEPTPGLRERIRQYLRDEGVLPTEQDDERWQLDVCAGVAALAASPAPEPGELETAYRIALSQIEHDREVIQRQDAALRVAAHSPHDQDGEPVEGFPVCSVCGAIQTAPEPTGLDAYFEKHGHEPYCPADYIIPEGPCECRAARLNGTDAGETGG